MPPPGRPPPRPNAAVLPKSAPQERDDSTVAVSADEIAAQVAQTRPPSSRAPAARERSPFPSSVVTVPEPPEERDASTVAVSREDIERGVVQSTRPAPRAAVQPAPQPPPQAAPPVEKPAPPPVRRASLATSNDEGVVVFSASSVPPPPKPTRDRTQFAQKAITLSDDFNATFADLVLQGPVPRVPRVVPPDVDSTGGGKLARESIVLAPQSGNGPSITCGYVDVGKSTAELRSLAYVARSVRGGVLGFSAEEYAFFLERAQGWLAGEGIKVRIAEEALPEAPGFAPSPSKSIVTKDMMPTIVVVAVVTALLGIVLGYFLL